DKFPELAQVFHDSVVQRSRELIRQILRLGIRRREFRISDLDTTVELLVSAVMSPGIQRSSHAFGARERFELKRHLRALMQLILHGISAPATTNTRKVRRS